MHAIQKNSGTSPQEVVLSKWNRTCCPKPDHQILGKKAMATNTNIVATVCMYTIMSNYNVTYMCIRTCKLTCVKCVESQLGNVNCVSPRVCGHFGHALTTDAHGCDIMYLYTCVRLQSYIHMYNSVHTYYMCQLWVAMQHSCRTLQIAVS